MRLAFLIPFLLASTLLAQTPAPFFPPKSLGDVSTYGRNRFVSNSGRVVIEPDDWNLEFCMKVFGPRLKEGDAAKWKVIPHFLDTATFTPAKDSSIENTQTVAQGLPNGKHMLELSGDLTMLKAIRVYSPPLK